MSARTTVWTVLVVAACGRGGDVAAGVAADAAATAADLVVVEGTRVVRVGPSGTTSLTEGLAAAAAPSVKWDATRVLFVAKERDGEPFAVWECAPDGSGRRVVARADGNADCGGAAHLPDGRVVYAAAGALYVAPGDGAAGARITFGDAACADPTVLSDGRVLFAAERAGAGGAARWGLFTVHPDGSGFAPFHLPADASATRPRQRADLDVVFTETPAGGGAGVRRVASWDAPMSLAADAPADAAGDGVLLAPRPRPQGHLSTVKPDVATGTLLCVDARRGLGLGPSAATAVAVRVHANGAALRDVPLAADGSFFVRVPADVPLRIETVDAAGAVVGAERGAFWVRRNENRACVGCHDDVETGPPNVRPRAVLQDPVDLTGAPAPGGVR